MRQLLVGFVCVLVACTGGPGPIDQTGNGNGSSSGLTGSSSGGPNSGTSSSGSTTPTSPATATVQASEFSQSCTDSTDCIAIYEGSVCNTCKCPNAAISKEAASEYAARFQNANCPATEEPCAADCAEATPVCAQGTCTINR